MKNDLYVEEPPESEAMEQAILLVIGSYGPLTIDELSIRLPVDQTLLANGLERLVEDGTVVNDYITPVFARQYILKTDLDALLGRGESNVLELRVVDFSSPVENVSEYFRKFGYAYSTESIQARCSGYSREELAALVEKGEVHLGRFVKNRLAYTADWLAKALYDLRYEPFKDEELQMLKYIENGHDTDDNIAERSGNPVKVVRQLIRSLEFRASITRSLDGRYSILNGSREKGDASEAVRTLIDRFGPVSKRELEHTFWAYMGEIIKGLEERPKYVRNDLYYGSRKLSGEPKDGVIIPVTDPLEIYFGRKYLNEIDYNSIYVSNGKEEATMSAAYNDNVLWVSNLTGSISSPAAFFNTVKDLAQNHNCQEIFISSVPENVAPHAEEAGFTDRSGALILGDASILEIEEEDLFSFAVSSAQKNQDAVVFDKLKEFHLGIRNEVEASYMGLRNALLRNYFQSRLLYNFSGPFGAQAMATMETISLYRAIKARELSDADQRIVHVIMEYGGATEAEIMSHLRKDVLGVRSDLKSLYSDCVIAKDSDRRYVFVPEKFKAVEAVDILVKSLLKNMGFIDVKRYEETTGRPMDKNFHKSMDQLIKSGKAVKGIIPGFQRLLYVNPAALKFKGGESRILIPKDIILLYFQEYIKRQLGSTNLYIMVQNGKLAAGFSARKSLKTLKVSKVIGDREYRDKMRKEMNEFGFAVSFN